MLTYYLAKYQLILTFGLAPFILFPPVSPGLNAAAWFILLTVWLIKWRIDGRFIQRTPLDISLLILLLLSPVSLWVSIDQVASVVALNRFLWGMVLFYHLGVGLTTRQGLYLLLGLVVLAGVVAALVGLVATSWNEGKITFLGTYYQYLPQLSQVPGVLAGRADAERGLFHPNMIAVTLGMIIPLGVGLVAPLHSGWQKAGLIIALLFMGGVLLLTQSRLATAALLIVLWVMAVSRWRWIWKLVFVAVILFVVTVWLVGPASFMERLAEQFLGQGVRTWHTRQEVWHNAVLALSDFPFTGVGLAVFEPVSRLLYPYTLAAPTWHFRHAHDNFLQVGLDFGLLGLVAYVALLLGLIWLGWQVYRASLEPFRSVVRGVLGSLGVYIGFGLFDALPFWVKPGFLPWLIFGLIVVCWQIDKRDDLLEKRNAGQDIDDAR